MEIFNRECTPPWYGQRFNKGELVLKRHRSLHQKYKDRERNKQVLQGWLAGDLVFLEISSFPSIVKKVRENQICIIMGSCNSGKTATMRHIALLLQNDYEVISVSDPIDIINFGYHDDIQLFTLDNFLNQLTVERKDMEISDYLDPSIIYVLGEKSKLIMTCDKVTFHLMKSHGFAFHAESVVDLDSEEYQITLEERERILERHLDDQTKSRVISEKLSLIRNIEHYPVLCHLFSRIDRLQDFHSMLFKRWRECILYMLDSLKRECSLQYAVLVLCVLSKNGLMPEKLEELVNEKYQFFLDINVNQKVCLKEVEKILSESLGKFVVISDNSSYVIIHTILAEEIALHYGRDFPAMLLSNMSYCFIQRWIEMHMDWTKHHQTLGNPISDIDNNSCTAVWSRLSSSIERGDLHSVFKSKLLCNKTILEKFMVLLEKKSFEEIKKTFLSPQPFFPKVVPGAFQGHQSWCQSNDSYQKIFMTASRDITEDMLLADRTREYKQWTQKVRIISWVIYHGHTEILEYILKVAKENGMDTSEALFMGTSTPEAEKEASRLLVLACYGGNEKIVKHLLSNVKAENVNQHSKRYCTSDIYHGDTPLTAACRRGHFPVVKLLIEAGAGVNHVNAFNESPLCAALESKNLVLIKFLLERKSTLSKSKLKHSKEPPNIDLLDLCMENGKSDVGNLMQMASKSGNLSSVKYLLNSLICSDQQNEFKTTSLMVAIKHGHQEVVKALLEAGAGSDGISALNGAINEGNLDIARDLIRHFKICKNMESDLTSLVHAAESGNFTILRELLITCPKEKCIYLAKNISLLDVISKGFVNLAILMIKHGANVNKEGYCRRTPLYAASEQGFLSVVLALICAGAKRNVQLNKNKYFPLYIASKNGHLEVVKLLIKAGANLKMKTEEGFTSLMIAVLENKHEIARYLVDAENSKESFSGSYHLFDILKSFERADFHLNVFDDIVPKRKYGLLVRNEGEIMEHIISKDVRYLRHILDLGTDPNNILVIYDGSLDKTRKQSFLSIFIDKWLIATQRIKKIELLVERGAKFSVNDLRYYPGCQCDSSFPDVMNEVRCHIRRNSI